MALSACHQEPLNNDQYTSDPQWLTAFRHTHTTYIDWKMFSFAQLSVSSQVDGV